MTFALLFWIIVLLWLVGVGLYGPRPFGPAYVPQLLMLILLLLLGWKVFGPALHQ